MQVNVREFSISIVKKIPQKKTIIVVCHKNKENQGPAYLRYNVHTVCWVFVNE